jgi:Tfp pilus assembly protein PilF
VAAAPKPEPKIEAKAETPPQPVPPSEPTAKAAKTTKIANAEKPEKGKKPKEKSVAKATAKAPEKEIAAAAPEPSPQLTAPATAYSAAPPTAPPPIMLPGTQIMPSPGATAVSPKEHPTPLMAQRAIQPDDRAVAAITKPAAAPGLPEVPYTAVQRWGNNEGPVAAQQPAAPLIAATAPTPTPLPSETPAIAAAPPAAEPPVQLAAASHESTEPHREISPESKSILDSLPPLKAEKSHAASAELEILRGKNAQEDKVAEVAPTSVNHEGMGIKIQVSTPHVNVDYELEKAYNALVSGNIEAASGIYRSVLENDPNNKNALFGLATIYHRAGQLEKARPLYAQLLTIDPNNRDGLNNFLVLLADEAPEDALSHLEHLRDANPDFSPIPAQMAVIYQKLGQTDNAIKNMTKAIELAPENLAYRYNFAIMLDKQKKYDEAAQLYRQILQAYQRGDKVPGNIQQIQQRLTFISSNRN